MKKIILLTLFISANLFAQEKQIKTVCHMEVGPKDIEKMYIELNECKVGDIIYIQFIAWGGGKTETDRFGTGPHRREVIASYCNFKGEILTLGTTILICERDLKREFS